MTALANLQSLVWDTADSILRDNMTRSEYGDHILPFVVLRRFEAMLSDKRDEILAYLEHDPDEILEHLDDAGMEDHIKSTFSVPFFSSSDLTLATIAQDTDTVLEGIETYLDSFSKEVREVWKKLDFYNNIEKEDEQGILWEMVQKFSELNLSPHRVDNEAMGGLFEHLMYMSFTTSAKVAGEFYTPRDVIELMVSILFRSDDDGLKSEAPARSIYDPTAGTAGMLLTAKRQLMDLNPDIDISLYGQEKMPKSWAIGAADILIQSDPNDEHAADSIAYGDTLVDDKFPHRTFDYVLANPPYGSDWKKVSDKVEKEAQVPGSRFSHGLPSVVDGQMLFLSHIAHKLTPAAGQTSGGRGAVVMNGSPLFIGDPGSGPDRIRAWLLENMVDAIIALPEQMFFNTGIATYIWILDKNKEPHRQGKIQLIDATNNWTQSKKSMGYKRRDLTEDDRKRILDTYEAFENSDTSYICTYTDLGFFDITVKRQLRFKIEITEDTVAAALDHQDITEDYRPVIEALEGTDFNDVWAALKRELKKHKLKNTVSIRKHIAMAVAAHDDNAPNSLDERGNRLLDPSSTMIERVPMTEDIDEHMKREVLPFVPNAVWDADVADEGYEIPFTRIFHRPDTPRSIADIDANIERLMEDIFERFREVKE